MEKRLQARERRAEGSKTYPAANSGLDKLWLGLAVCFVVFAIVVILRTPLLPMQDFEEWVYQSYLLKLLLVHPSAPLPVVLKHWPVPNDLSQCLLAGLMLLFHAVTAARVFIIGYLVLGSAALWRMSRLRGGMHANLLFLAMLPLLLVNTTFWTGEMNYQVGLLIFLTYVVTPAATRDRWPAVLTFSLLLVVTHALPYAFLVLFVLAGGLRLSASWKRLMALVPSVLLALWYLLADPRRDDATEYSPVLHGAKQWLAYRAYIFSKLGVYHNFVYDGMGDAGRAHHLYLAGVVANSLMLLGIVALLLIYLGEGLRRHAWSPALFIAALCAVLAFIDPAALLHNANTGERLLLPAVALALLGMGDAARWQRIWYAFAGCAATGFLLATAVHVPHFSPAQVTVETSAINTQEGRSRLLYWTRPYAGYKEDMFVVENERNHAPDDRAPRLSFETGMFLRAGTRGK